MNTMQLSQFTASFGGNFGRHSVTLADRYSYVKPCATATASEMLETPQMEPVDQRRRRKLNLLIEQFGGLNPPTRKIEAGHYAIARRVIEAEGTQADPKQMGQALRQAATNWKGKNLGSENARRIEAALKLGDGWFDSADETGDIAFGALSAYEAALITNVRNAKLSPEEIASLAEVVGLAGAGKNNGATTDAPHDPVRVYFHYDRRQQDIPPAGQDRRGSSKWKSGSSITESSAPPGQERMKRGSVG